MPLTGGSDAKASPKNRLKTFINEWERLTREIRGIRSREETGLDPGGQERLDDLLDERRDYADRVVRILKLRPRLVDFAIQQGFSRAVLEREGIEDPTPPQGPPSPGGASASAGGRNQDDDDDGTAGDRARRGGGGGGGGGGQPNLRAQRVDNRLLGDKGKDYYIARGPKGSYVAVYTYKIAGETVRVGVRIPKGQLAKYGVKEGDARQLTAQQMRRIKSIGWADELAPHIRKGDSNVLKSLTRSLRRQYGGQAILEDDEVMSVIIANSMFGWTAGEFENQLRNTKWYRNTNDYQREWALTVSPKQKRDTIRQTQQQVINALEEHYGLEWTKYVEGGMKQVRTWAEKIASGQFGTPDAGFSFWAERQFDRASQIEGTPAWTARELEQEEQRRLLNRPEDERERLRQEAMAYLGYAADNTPLLDRADLTQWADDLVSERKSDGDWAQFLRQQMKALHPYFDPNRPWQEQISPYKAMAEALRGSPIPFSHKLFRRVAALDDKGNPTDRALSLQEFELLVRDPDIHPEAFREGTRLYDEGMGMLSEVLNRMRGVA